MAIRLLAVDLDDTLLNEECVVSEANKQAIKEAVARGVIVTIATGRMFESAQKIAKQLEIDVPLISYNGALVQTAVSEEVLMKRCLDEDAARAVLDLFREKGWYIQLYRGDKLYVDTVTNDTREYESRVETKATAIGQALYDDPKDILKMLAINDPEKIDFVEETVHTLLSGKVFAPRSMPRFLEIVNAKVNKGEALRFVAEHFGVKREEVMAIGDSNNDIAMVEYAGLGVAMGNATPRVKEAADVMTASNAQDGVAKAIREYILAK
ncbi:MAG: HAD family phosphatase [Selenomonadales bacterium]|nr:HAD family phosphatase [Selenomonadales bacterium]